ncbi:hypothetical protein JHK87_025361 [Glycine soja]|nr:hypothetical protein JHK87_025361 [Glycine soja]
MPLNNHPTTVSKETLKLKVGPLAAYYQVPFRHILLVFDETSLPNGVLRLQPKGGHGHHNE